MLTQQRNGVGGLPVLPAPRHGLWRDPAPPRIPSIHPGLTPPAFPDYSRRTAATDSDSGTEWEWEWSACRSKQGQTFEGFWLLILLRLNFINLYVYISVYVGSRAVAAAATGCCTTALLTERLLRAVDDGVHRPSPPDTRPVGVWVAAPLVCPWSERMNAMWRSSL